MNKFQYVRTTLSCAILIWALTSVFAVNAQPFRFGSITETISQLSSESNPVRRQELILSIAEFPKETIQDNERTLVRETLLNLYELDPDPGVHSAINWVLGKNRQGELPRIFNWQQNRELIQIDNSQLGQYVESRNWYVSNIGQTMSVVRGPVNFVAGANEDEVGSFPDEVQHEVTIPRNFAIGTTEVTVEQFQQFLDENPAVVQLRHTEEVIAQIEEAHLRFSPDLDGPLIMVSWYEAAMFCNWLSEKAGLPVAEWVYPPDLENIRSGFVLPADYLQRSGYRLPTEAEWEYAVRAGSTTSRFYGESDEELDQYGWYAKNPITAKDQLPDPNDPKRTYPVGQLKPNQFGLFDVYGNVWEWGHDRARDFEPDSQRIDSEDSNLIVVDEVARTRRGGSFPYGAYASRSAHRGAPSRETYFPMQRRDNVGFRIARTITDPAALIN